MAVSSKKKSKKFKNKKKNTKQTKKYVSKKGVASSKKKLFDTTIFSNKTQIFKNLKNDIDNSVINDNDIKRNRPKLVIMLVFILILLIIYFSFPKIYLNGNKKMTITYKDTYSEPGYKAKIFFRDISNKVKVYNRVSLGVVGTYQVDYIIRYGIIDIKKKRIVKIVDNEKPVIEALDTLEVCPGTKAKPKYKVIDGYEGDISDKVIMDEDNDLIKLMVSDRANNVASKEIKLTYGDTVKPEITLVGDNPLYLFSSSRYSEPGYTANDNCDGDITSNVSVSGNVGIRAGTYEITYRVSDVALNETVVTRTVIVKNNYNSGNSLPGVVYLTFDDGPNEGTTNVILDILKETGVKATFFVTCNGPDYLIKRMYDEGHTVALHTATHSYAYIYSSVDNYFADLNRVSSRVTNLTGIESKIIRFPGGSSNTVSRNYQVGIMTTLTSMVLDRGYRYFDWNVDAKDASTARSSQDVYYNVVSSLSPTRANVVLMHDVKGITRDALRDIIAYGQSNGYQFSRIENDTYMVRHSVNN